MLGLTASKTFRNQCDGELNSAVEVAASNLHRASERARVVTDCGGGSSSSGRS